MNRNTEQHFGTNPSIEISRSKFDRSNTLKTSFDTGQIIPLYWDDILPGDTVKMRTSQVVRMATPAVPVMDNAWIDTYWFFVPNRLIWEHWQEFMGENKTEPWIQNVPYTIPQITAPENGWNTHSLADYLGYPVGVDNISVSALPTRAYCTIFNEWFRDENLVDPIYISLGDSDTTGKNKGNDYDYVTDTECGAYPVNAAKPFDYFTGALPAPQKGPQVTIPLGTEAPLKAAKTTNLEITGYTNWTQGEGKELAFVSHPVSSLSGDEGNLLLYTDEEYGTAPSMGKNNMTKLVTDLSNATAATIAQLRQAFQIQHFYERAARGGTRYIESLRSHFSVINPDFRLQRPEYLGGERVPITMNQVVQNSESATTPQGTTAAYSLTVNVNEDVFTHSFTEHGIIMCLGVVRTTHTYQQGINRSLSRKNIFDFYWPEFANLSEQAILNKEIYAQGTNEDNEAFGYQECWAEYRYKPDQITGELRSQYAQSLDVWHYGDDYSELPKLSAEWITETDQNVKRTLAVQNHNQFIGDFYFGGIYTRPMPLYSIPGLIDHH